MVVYLAPNIFQFSKGSPAPTRSWSQIRSSTRTNDPTSFDHPPTANTSPPSSTRQNSNFNFLGGHHLPPIDYARPRRQQSPISTLHLANLRRPLPHLEVHVSANMRCDVIIHTAALPHLEVVITILITTGNNYAKHTDKQKVVLCGPHNEEHIRTL